MQKILINFITKFFILLFVIVIPVNMFGKSPVRVIFDTDMGNDIDDALALAMLFRYADENKLEILSIMCNKDDVSSVEYIDIMNCYYGYEQIPIGKLSKGSGTKPNKVNFAGVVSGDKSFKRAIKDYSKLPESVDLYRKILSEQPDSSVVIISVGFLTNLTKLLNSCEDQYSSLRGFDLIKKKVKYLSLMGGDFRIYGQHPEYNIRNDVQASKDVMEKWPTEIIISPWELGATITFPAYSIIEDFRNNSKHPLVLAYNAYDKMPYDRPTWDLTSVMYVVENTNFDISPKGVVTVDGKGFSSFRYDIRGKHLIISADPWQAQKIKKRFVELIGQKSKLYQ